MAEARTCAYRVLKAVSVSGAFSPRALDAEIKRASLSEQDASLAANIVYGTLEREALLDAYIERELARKGKLRPEIRVILRLSAYQLLFCEKIPAYSAINDGVELAKSVDPHSGGFVNAVLRNIERHKGESVLPDAEADPGGYLSLRYSVEKWIAEEWIKEYGFAAAEALLAACEGRPPLTVRVNTLKTDSDALVAAFAAEGVKAEKHPLVPDLLTVTGTGSVDGLAAYREGLFHVQDAASAFCCGLLGAKAGDTVYDVCAAPGGKSFTLAEMMKNEGVLRSFDISEKKLGLLRDGAERLGISIISAGARNAAEAEPLPEADAVLCDVPCSGLGVIRRKPEIRRKRASEVAALPEIQAKILKNSSRCLRRGGTLVYSTCTLLRAENEAVVERFLAENPDFAPLPFTTPFGVEDWRVTLRPDLCGTDGFFMARMVKI
ncbi:MAG: 16S rRNA (cytosine(967)-C(5))-methyltransferase RsmB [Clostridia bacterium]|nr:16S rRNA (cytosine(967)-C(5))-methyltransferase RsmB [Clostridia bacterium]